jgi:nucleoside-diphosphate-sugar epimerase
MMNPEMTTSPPDRGTRIVLPGGAGLVGQNLVARLRERGWRDIVVLDKHRANLEVLKRLQPDVTTELADLSQPGDWQRHFDGAGVCVMLQAQIGGLDYAEFERNNVESTRLILDAVRRHAVPRLVHISSSVVESVADDFYTRSKRAQEALVLASGLPCPILRPTLMFGWFDRKHLGWLARFMRRVPVFPIPGDGRYMRQPLYVGDFCNIIISCIDKPVTGVFNISGHERVDYVDIIHAIRRSIGARTPIVHIPYGLFHALLWLWSCVDRNPPFTTQQLAALVARDEFEVIDWPGLFGVRCTPFAEAIDETFRHPRFADVALEF